MTPEALFTACLPIETGLWSLSLVPETIDEDTGEIHGGFFSQEEVIAVLQLLRRDEPSGPVREVKEQKVVVVPAGMGEDPRLAAYFAGWAEAVRVVFAEHEERAAAGTLPRRSAALLDAAVPAELVDGSVLSLKRPREAADFTDALLQAKRIGRFLPR